ncbi:hypothetical protein K2X30_09635 [bacterium]|jgi:hypothetical protein|nr:hypothetical protein [bacterium]
MKLKTYWKDRTSQIWMFFCPLCKAQRRLPFRPTPGSLRHYLQVGLTSLVFTLATWDFFSWKGILSFLPFWTLFEIAYRVRSRAMLSCSQCGFDPYLYMTDLDRAKSEVRAHWRKKFEEKGLPNPYQDELSAEPVSEADAAAR